MKRIIMFIIALAICFMGIIYCVYQDINEFYFADQDLIKKVSSSTPDYTKIDKIPKELVDAILAVEDKRFYMHYGFDILGIGRAFISNLREGEVVQGGSTITQQLAKNLFLSSEKSLKRKLKELFIAVKIESLYTKEEILEMYLNTIYYGAGAHGIQAASKTYFNKNVEDLTVTQCTMLAGLPQAPSLYNPKKYLERAKKRQEIVVDSMSKNGYISKEIEKKIKKQMICIFQ
ncbi:transglycosylase domain-containing protein [Paramaledivibacter caminithermalis]|uniref:Penicillin-binding protein 1A n=1 Tax=Paramaledivibacter caminithermalis (strain DSM 15212 / CIP 107654 / DViRD3) TaxID=1121301 RepID=A0A1M6MW79_PARC5|nr:biosynthetic peptidoglycan transglycosylase [Paramaledivibacter caminithermalis]SHJ87731.1 Transglycosylase [Paramaledivibacter caminithermalis DSM 15212]